MLNVTILSNIDIKSKYTDKNITTLWYMKTVTYERNELSTEVSVENRIDLIIKII